MGLVRSCVGFFADAGSADLDKILIDLTGLFVQPIAQILGSGAAGPGIPALTPPINTAAFEMLTEALRHWNLVSLGIRATAWLPEVLDHAIEALPRLAEENQVVHERTVCAMLRFVRNLLIWADPETSRGDGGPELREMQQSAQALVSERPLPRGLALPRIIAMLARLLAAAASNGPTKGDVVPTVAEVLRVLLLGPFEYATSSGIPQALRALPSPLGESLPEQEQQRLIQQLKMEKADSRRFVRTVVGVAEVFAVSLKRAQFGG